MDTEGQLYTHLRFSGYRWNKVRFIYCDLDVDLNMGSSFPESECRMFKKVDKGLMRGWCHRSCFSVPVVKNLLLQLESCAHQWKDS